MPALRGIVKEGKMKRTIAAVIMVALGTAVFVVPALSWEKGTHLYIADKLKRQGRINPMNLDEMYGAMAPDIFNYVFDLPTAQYDYLYDQTHHYYYNMWRAVKWGYEKPLAFGFVSHNDTWGADYTAHHKALTVPADPGDGYVIFKAKLLLSMIDWDALAIKIGATVPPEVQLELCHNIVEAAGDIVLKRFYPQLGKNLVAAGNRSDKRFRNLFLKAYLPGLITAFSMSEDAAKTLLLNGEAAFRTYQVIMYGVLFQQDEATVIAGIADQFGDLVSGYLLSKGITIPAGTDLTTEILAALQGAIYICQSDYMIEVDATVNYLRAEMKRRKFWGSTKKGDIS